MRKRCQSSFVCNVVVRVLLFVIFCISELPAPFIREIQPEELWLYKFQHIENDYVSYSLVFSISLFTPVAAILLFSFLDTTVKGDLKEASLAMSLTLILNGIVSNVLKVTVGRPRPDFFYRCFPDGQMNPELLCNGDPQVVLDGRKSFPSAHSSSAFAGLGFTALYLGGKLHCFSPAGRGEALRLCAFLAPLFVALMIAVSRTCDYKHHWQDVLVGSVMGTAFAYLCYRQHYPALSDPDSHKPLQHEEVTPAEQESE